MTTALFILLIPTIVLLVIEVKYSPRLDFNNGITLWYNDKNGICGRNNKIIW